MSSIPAAPGSFVSPYRVRFDEAGSDGLIRTSTLLRYAQDCAWLHSESLGFDRGWYEERGIAWLVRVASVRVLAAIETGGRLEVATAVVGFRRVWGGRHTTVSDTAGRAIADIRTDWVMTDLLRGAPVRVPDDLPRRFGTELGTYEPHRVVLAGPAVEAGGEAIRVRPADLDPMGHANNASYLDWLEEVVLRRPDGAGRLVAMPRRYLLEYLTPAGLGDDLSGIAMPDPRDPEVLEIRLGTSTGDVLRARLESGPPGWDHR